MINIPNSLACFSIVYFVVHAEVSTATVFVWWAVRVSIYVCSALFHWHRELHIMTAISGSGDRRYDTKYQCPIQCTFLSCPQCRLMVLQRLRMCIAMCLAKIICDNISDINVPSTEKKNMLSEWFNKDWSAASVDAGLTLAPNIMLLWLCIKWNWIKPSVCGSVFVLYSVR